MLTAIFAQAAEAAGPAGQPQGGMGMLVTMLIIFAIFYFLMIRPQQRKEKERRKTIDALRAGQRILFAGGFIGRVAEVKQNTFVVEIAAGTKVEIARGAVSAVLGDDEAPAEPEK